MVPNWNRIITVNNILAKGEYILGRPKKDGMMKTGWHIHKSAITLFVEMKSNYEKLIFTENGHLTEGAFLEILIKRIANLNPDMLNITGKMKLDEFTVDAEHKKIEVEKKSKEGLFKDYHDQYKSIIAHLPSLKNMDEINRWCERSGDKWFSKALEILKEETNLKSIHPQAHNQVNKFVKEYKKFKKKHKLKN